MRRRSTCPVARRKRHSPRSTRRCRTTRTSWSAASRSGPGREPRRRRARRPLRGPRPVLLPAPPARLAGARRRPDRALAADPLPGPAALGRVRPVRADRPPAGRRAPTARRRARHISEAGAHAQAGPRRRARSRGGLPARRARLRITAQIFTASTCRARQMSLSFGPLNSTRSCAPNAAQPVPPGNQGRLRRPLPARRSTTGALTAPEEGRSRIATPKPSRCRGQRRRPGGNPVHVVPGAPSTKAHAPEIDRFLYALSQVESGGKYTARNRKSGAYGRYQIMPMNWKPWAKKYIGTSRAKQTPRNQEFVARGKMHALYHWLGSWRRVAYWWLTGKSNTSGWSAFAKHYVNNVMAIYKRTRHREEPAGDIHRYSEKSSAIAYRGSWSRAEHRSYRGDRARQAKRKGQTATFRFTEPGRLERTEGPDARQGEGVHRWQYVKTGRPVRASLRRARPDLHEDLRPIRSARLTISVDGHEGPPGRLDRRVRRLGVTGPSSAPPSRRSRSGTGRPAR